MKALKVADLFRPGVKTVRDNWKPILLIQVAALVFVILFYAFPQIQRLDPWLAFQRDRLGIWFVLLGVWFASIFVSEVARLLTGLPGFRMPWQDWLFLIAYYGAIGLIVDRFYRGLDAAFGSNLSVGLVVLKIALDMFLFAPLVTMPLVTVAFGWRDAKFNFGEAARLLRREFWARYFPILATCWLYFGPWTIVLYSLPKALTFPASMAAQAGWSVIIVRLASRPPTPCERGDSENRVRKTA